LGKAVSCPPLLRLFPIWVRVRIRARTRVRVRVRVRVESAYFPFGLDIRDFI
jgi:hypothetical protein